MQIRCLSGTLRARAGIQDTKIGSRKIKLAKTSQKYDFPNTLRLHYNAVLYTRSPRGFQIFFKYMCENVSRRSQYTQCKLKIVLTMLYWKYLVFIFCSVNK